MYKVGISGKGLAQSCHRRPHSLRGRYVSSCYPGPPESVKWIDGGRITFQDSCLSLVSEEKYNERARPRKLNLPAIAFDEYCASCGLTVRILIDRDESSTVASWVGKIIGLSLLGPVGAEAAQGSPRV